VLSSQTGSLDTGKGCGREFTRTFVVAVNTQGPQETWSEYMPELLTGALAIDVFITEVE
jgi:hypothetical protein